MTDLINFSPVIKTDVEALEDLVLDNDLDRLEGFTSGFNIFESIGAVRREIRHSDFLSFLLNPKESHGLHDVFIKSILFDVVKRNRSAVGISPIDIDLLDLSNIEVRREWENIDILLLSDVGNFVCAIENKIDTTEHSNQLSRYESQVNASFENYNTLFIYLTLDGSPPENNENWLSYSYQDIYEVLISILKESEGNIGQDIYVLLKHYVEMINRHFMSDNEIAALSKKIYLRHKQALDIIFEHKPDVLTETNTFIIDYLEKKSNVDVVVDYCGKCNIRFSLKRWDQVDGQLTGDGQWTKSNRVLLFEVVNNLNEITLKLLIGPGLKEFREGLFKSVSSEAKIFKGKSKSLYGKWTQIYKRKIVTKEQMDLNLESIKDLITQELNNFFYYGEFEKLHTFFDEKFGLDVTKK